MLRVLRGPVLLWHELGHALPALALSRGEVGIRLEPERRSLRLGSRLRLGWGPGAVRGRTEYDPAGLSRLGRSAIVLGGPLASLLGLALGLLVGLRPDLPFAARFLGLVWSWAHLRVLLFTLFPLPSARADDPALGGDWADLRGIWGG